MKFTTKILEEILGTKLKFQDSFNKLSVDSRNIENGDIFVGIKGQKVDGNSFAKQALASGARCCIIDNKNFLQNDKAILVNDSLEFLKKIGKFSRNKAQLQKLIAITGSTGKTTTKVWTNQILQKRFRSFASTENYNTIYGIPLSLSMMPEETEYGIFELGTNNVGEISELSNYLLPDIGIIANIYESHIGHFKDKQTLMKEKISIIDGIERGGILIYDGDSEFRKEIQQKASVKSLRLFSVGFSQNCDFSIKKFNNSIVELKTPDDSSEYKIAPAGKHFAYVSALVVAVLYAINAKVSDFLPYFGELSPLPGRGKIFDCIYDRKQLKIIDNSYNASPSATLASIEVLSSMKAKHKTAVIGQMGELGNFEEYYHKLVAEKLRTSEIDSIFFIGNERLWPIFQNLLGNKITCFPKINKFVIEKILEMTQNMSVVLVKGSRNVELNQIVEYLNTGCFTI